MSDNEAGPSARFELEAGPDGISFKLETKSSKNKDQQQPPAAKKKKFRMNESFAETHSLEAQKLKDEKFKRWQLQQMMAAEPLGPFEIIVIFEVEGKDGTEVRYRADRRLTLGETMKEYCIRKEIDITKARFRYNGSFLTERSTPDILKMSSGAVIEVILESTKKTVDPVEESEVIELKFEGDVGVPCTFKVAKGKRLERFMRKFCARSGLDRHMIRFLHNGRNLNDETTPLDMGMEDGDVIEVFPYLDGGSWAF